MSNWGRLSEPDNKQWTEWEHEYMPAAGNCDTLAGEIIRAMDRIIYRWYNDGDTVEEYYGSDYNHCKGANIFLMENIPGFKTLEMLWGDDYEEEVCKRLKFVLDYLSSHPELFETENTEDFLDLSPYEPYEEEEEEDWDEDDY